MKLFTSPPPSSGLGIATLAPMVDIFTILVIAVLRASSPEPPLSLPEGNFELPVSQQQESSTNPLVIDIGKEGIYIDGYRVTSRKYWEESSEIIVSEVYANLQQRAKKEVKIRSDADAPWSLLSKILQSAQHAGYEDIELLVLSNSSL